MRTLVARRAYARIGDGVSAVAAQVLGDLGGTLRVAHHRAVAVSRATAYRFGSGQAHPAPAAGLCADRTPQYRTLHARAFGARPGGYGRPPLPKLRRGTLRDGQYLVEQRPPRAQPRRDPWPRESACGARHA